jgi:hypothetical protein
MHMSGFAASLRPYEGAIELLAALRAIPGARVVALTAPLTRSPTWIPERLHWLAGMGFDAHDVIFCPGDLKGRFAVDVLIEDRPETVDAAHPDVTTFLVSRPWTRNACEDDDCPRCHEQHPREVWTLYDLAEEIPALVADSRAAS